MKKIYSFLIGCILLSLSGQVANAQFSVILFEDFESSTIPTGWTKAQQTGSNGWEFGITDYNNNGWIIPAHPGGGMFTAANDAECNCDASSDELYTPVMDWTPYDSVLVLFDAYFDALWGGDGIMQVSYNGGTDWDTYGIPDVEGSWQEGLGVSLDPILDGPFTANMVVRFVYNDLGGWRDGFAIDNVAVLGYHDVCSSVINISGCDQPQSVSLEGPGDLFWDFDECWATPGWEQLYQFTAPTTGTYNIEVTSSNGEWIDYLWKPVSMGCDTGDWTCISDVTNPGIWGGFYLTAGQSIYIVADAEGYALTEQTFKVVCPCSNPISVPSGTPEGEACGDSITDGCNNEFLTDPFGSISCGETIIGNTFANSGTRDTDWFKFTVNQTTDVTLTGMADFAMNLVIFDNCTDLNDLAFDQVAACETATATANLTPGAYLALVSPVSFSGYLCGNYNYWINLDMGTTVASITPGPNVQICEGTTTSITASGLGGTAPYSYLWDNANTVPNLTDVLQGIHCVTVTDANGCVDSTCDTVVEISAPAADFTFSQNATSVDFTDATAPTPDTWLWTFGDSNSASTQNPNHTYNGGAGTYVTELIAAVDPGCNDTASYLVNVSSSGCVSQHLMGPDVNDHLNGFVLNSHDNSGDGYTQDVAYTDNTGSSITTLNRGSNYSLTFHGSGNDYETFAAWIDYNQNGVFNSGELLGECTSSGGTCTISFTVPANATLGNSTIRLIAQETLSSGLEPCYNSYSYGETEDYTVQIDGFVGLEEVVVPILEVYPNPTENVLNINFQSEENSYLEVRLTNTIGQVVRIDTKDYFKGGYKNSFDLSDLPVGNYMLQIITEKGMINKKIVVK